MFFKLFVTNILYRIMNFFHGFAGQGIFTLFIISAEHSAGLRSYQVASNFTPSLWINCLTVIYDIG